MLIFFYPTPSNFKVFYWMQSEINAKKLDVSHYFKLVSLSTMAAGSQNGTHFSHCKTGERHRSSHTEMAPVKHNGLQNPYRCYFCDLQRVTGLRS